MFRAVLGYSKIGQKLQRSPMPTLTQPACCWHLALVRVVQLTSPHWYIIHWSLPVPLGFSLCYPSCRFWQMHHVLCPLSVSCRSPRLYTTSSPPSPPICPWQTTHPCTVAMALSVPGSTLTEQIALVPPLHRVCHSHLTFSVSSSSGQLFPARDRGVPQWGRVHEGLQPPARHPTPRYLE